MIKTIQSLILTLAATTAAAPPQGSSGGSFTFTIEDACGSDAGFILSTSVSGSGTIHLDVATLPRRMAMVLQGAPIPDVPFGSSGSTLCLGPPVRFLWATIDRTGPPSLPHGYGHYDADFPFTAGLFQPQVYQVLVRNPGSFVAPSKLTGGVRITKMP